MNARKVLVGGAMVLACAFSASSAWAQFGTVRGKVVDEKGAPLLEAEGLLEGQGDVSGKKYTLKANKKGDFTQVGMPRGQYKATVSKQGYQSVVLGVQVATGDTADLGDVKLPVLAAGGAGP